jgi:hypothetical protein
MAETAASNRHLVDGVVGPRDLVEDDRAADSVINCMAMVTIGVTGLGDFSPFGRLFTSGQI